MNPRATPLLHIISPTGMPSVRDRGYVLIITLWVLVLLSMMLTGLSYQVRVETALERRALEQSKLRLAARGAIHVAGARLREHAGDKFHSPGAPWWSDETLYRDQPIGEALVSLPRPSGPGSTRPRFGLDDGESRLNVNTAEPEQLMGFPGISTVLAESIARFRRGKQGSGAEKDEEATSANEDEEAPILVDGPIGSLRELLQVEGVTEALLFAPSEDGGQPLADFLTCVSSGRVNVNSAPEAVLTAVGFAEGQVNLLMAQRRQGVTYGSLEEVKDALGLVDTQEEKWQRLRKFLTVRSSTFRLKAVAGLPGIDAEYSAEATVFAGAEKLVFTRWQEY